MTLGDQQSIAEPAWNGRPERVRVPYATSIRWRWAHHPSTAGHEKPCRNPGGPPPKTNYADSPIVHEYREGTVKSTPGGE